MRRLLPIALGLACVLVVILAIQNRTLTKRHNDLLLRGILPRPGLFVPTASVRSLDGEEVTIGEPKPGGTQLLFVYTTTCPYCRASLPAWESIAARARSSGPGNEVYGVSLDSVDATRDYAKTHKLSFPTVLFPPGKLPTLYRTANVPVTMIIDAAGRVAYARVGVLTEQIAVDSVLAALKQAPDRVSSPQQTASGATISTGRTHP